MLYFVRKHLRSFIKRNCRPFYCIWYCRRKESWKKTRYLSSALAGAICAYLLSKILFASFVFPRKYEKCFLILSSICLSCGFVFTDSVKCITLLIFIALMGKSGRSYLRAICFAFIIAGPIENLSSNAGEIVRVFTCSKMLTLNFTRTRIDLMTKPFQKTLAHMKDDIKEVRKTFNELRDVTKAIHNEILEDDPTMSDDELAMLTDNQANIGETGFPSDSQHINNSSQSLMKTHDTSSNEAHNADYVETKYRMKFQKRCMQQLSSGKARCRKAFANSLQKCREKMPYMLKTLICWPFRIDFVCKINILGNPDKICNASDVIPNDFGQTYVNLLKTEDKLYEGSEDVKIHYTVLNPKTMPELESAKETAKLVAKEFSLRKRRFDSIMIILEQLLAFTLLKVFIACLSYHKQYKNAIDHDNIYISEYFKRIDLERKTTGKSSVLPLKKYERKNLIDVDNIWQRTTEESRAVILHLMQFALEIVTALFFVFFDYIIVNVLMIIRKNSQMSFVQEGEHAIHFSIQGTGLIARLLRSTMHNFNMHETVSTYTTNEACLPRPNILHKSFYLKILTLYTLVIILIYQSATILRMRRLICGYFYRKREKRRIIYLYNCLMKQRRLAKEAMLKQTKSNFANRKVRLKANMILNLRLRWPQHFGWLVRFNAGRRKCIICDEFENEHFVICHNTLCGISYCDECWLDMGNECLVCNDIISMEMVLNFNDFFEEFEFV